MPVLGNIAKLAICAPRGGQSEIGRVPDAALVWDEGVIRWAGPEAALPAEHRALPRWDAGGRLVVPGLVDCHTHLGFGGWRADEFEQRVRGASYLEIARRGGGIASTVRATRRLDRDALVARCLGFLDEIVRLGVTTIECKSGYGLDEATELRTLRAYREADERHPARLASTFLGAHVVPPEYEDDPDGYVRFLCDTLIPRVAEEGLAEFCDVFVEESAFTVERARTVLEAGRRHGLRPKLHADQLTDGGGAELAAEVGAVSADHLEHVSDAGIRALAESGTVAVSLPFATLYLGQPPMPARKLIEGGVPVAVATDFNPGSAPSHHLPLALMLACTLQRMTPAEALKGATILAARAIGRDDAVGSLEPDKRADFVVLDSPSVNHWLYHFRANAAVATVIDGRVAWEAESGALTLTGG